MSVTGVSTKPVVIHPPAPLETEPVVCGNKNLLPPVPRQDASLTKLWSDQTKSWVDAPAPKPRARLTEGCARQALSLEEANTLFKELSQLGFVRTDGRLEPLTFHYPTDGCYFRAQVMAERIGAQGISVGKVFATGSLRVASDYANNAPANQPGTVYWGWHVAPTVRVKMPNGDLQTMVMDPALADHPITPAEWNAIMGGQANLRYVSANVYFPPWGEAGQTTPQGATSQHQGVRDTLTSYADLVPAHELAADLRRAVRERGLDAARELLASKGEKVRADFAREYPMLSSSLAAAH